MSPLAAGAALSALSLAAGCAAGRPTLRAASEVLVFGVSARQLAEAVKGKMRRRGYRLHTATAASLAFAKAADPLTPSMLLGARYDAPQETRIRFDFAAAPDGWRVAAAAEGVTNPGTDFEYAAADDASLDADQAREVLADLRAMFPAPPRKEAPAPVPKERPEPAPRNNPPVAAKSGEGSKPSEAQGLSTDDEDMIEAMRRRALGVE